MADITELQMDNLERALERGLISEIDYDFEIDALIREHNLSVDRRAHPTPSKPKQVEAAQS